MAQTNGNHTRPVRVAGASGGQLDRVAAIHDLAKEGGVDAKLELLLTTDPASEDVAELAVDPEINVEELGGASCRMCVSSTCQFVRRSTWLMGRATVTRLFWPARHREKPNDVRYEVGGEL